MNIKEQIEAALQGMFDRIKELFSGAGSALAQVHADLATAKASIASLSDEIATEKSSLKVTEDRLVKMQADLNSNIVALEKENADLKAKLADPKGEIQRLAALKAAEITAGQGQPPVPAAPAKGSAVAANLTGLERAIAAHKESYSARN